MWTWGICCQLAVMFTDGACRGNPGPGGWAALLRTGAKEREMAGGEPLTTNNRMELMAAIKGLEALKRPCRVRLHTDSTYVRDGITRWIHEVAAERLAHIRQEAGQECRAVAGAGRRGGAAPDRWHWVKGHSGHPENDRVDALACAEADKLR